MTVEENIDSWQWNVVESSDLTRVCAYVNEQHNDNQ